MSGLAPRLRALRTPGDSQMLRAVIKTVLLYGAAGLSAMACGAPAVDLLRGPQPAPLPPAIPAPRDVLFAGTISLAVDATDTLQKVFKVHETIPVQSPGKMILLYPEWETASHAATASVSKLAGLVIHAGPQRLDWQRDPVDTHAFHVDVPAGTRALELDFQYLSPVSGRSGATVATPELENVQWHSVLLYPAGWFTRNIEVAATLTLPSGFAIATSLVTERTERDAVAFRPTSLETLVDSPVYAGRYTRRIDLDPGAAAPVTLEVLADAEANLAIPAAEIEKLRALVEQTRRLFASRHYDRYHFIVSLSDTLPSGGGLEHLESSENNLPADYFTDLAHQLPNRDLLAHEYVHSWNGRFRQPADQWTANFNVPMRNSLLWVYEGQTELWGRVLAARAGLRTTEETLDSLALDAAIVDHRVGRAWKSLQDSNNDPLYVAGRPIDWRDWQRREDYYPEGAMLWLAVDGVIRQRSGGTRSLDDFARAFFGIHDGSRVTVTYTFADVCAALGQIVPYDWAAFLRQRLDAHDDRDVLDGLIRGGYRLVYTDTPTASFAQAEANDGIIDLAYSIGLTLTTTGVVRAVAWNGPAFQAGIPVGARLASVNGKPYAGDTLRTAVKTASTEALELAYETRGRTQTARIDYHGSLRYPRLQRIEGTPDLLGQLLAPLPGRTR